MGTQTLTQDMKNFMIAHVLGKRPEDSCYSFQCLLIDFRSLTTALKACGQDVTRLDLAINGVVSSLHELKLAAIETRLQFEKDPFPSGIPEEEQLM